MASPASTIQLNSHEPLGEIGCTMNKGNTRDRFVAAACKFETQLTTSVW